MDAEFQTKNLFIDPKSHKIVEEIAYSKSYPGLRTVYTIHKVQCRIKEPNNMELTFLGLPEANDFTITRMLPTGRSDSPKRQCGRQVAITWTWVAAQSATRLDQVGRTMSDRSGPKDMNYSKRRVDTPHNRQPEMSKLSFSMEEESKTPGCQVLRRLMKDARTDWDKAWNAARNMCQENYTLKNFFDDCIGAFPELSLYVVSEDDASGMSGGRSGDDEYQRTMGALFAVYWLMRGKPCGNQAFCFGVDESWQPLSPESTSPPRSPEEAQKRIDFLEKVQWEKFEDLFVDSGLLTRGETVTHSVERTLAMLVLTAIHDIMKVRQLLPVADEAFALEDGTVQAGEVISDHDQALGYVLVHHPEVLPSFHGLPDHLKECVRFTQAKMEYNMGWLVQAEAPPGALFRRFKKVIDAGQADPRDVAFYFVHWVTDLAGAETFPKEGCEKFVLKFPRRVLVSFLESFSIVQRLSTQSETQVFEEYLLRRWQQLNGSKTPVSGEGSIAQLRLVVMAQGESKPILSAYRSLSKQYKDVLNVELARTGCKGQKYQRDQLRDSGGPAFLVYYGPALMQKAGPLNADKAMQILAVILREARELWPLQNEHGDNCVTIRIDALKELDVYAITSLSGGDAWVLDRTGSTEAQVIRVNLHDETLNKDLQRVLRFGGE